MHAHSYITKLAMCDGLLLTVSSVWHVPIQLMLVAEWQSYAVHARAVNGEA